MSKISLEPEIEEPLIKRAQSKNTLDAKEAFGILYEHYHPHILKFFQKRLSDETVAEDLASQVFEKALNAIDNFQWQGISFSAWIFKIARNLLIDYFRSQNKARKTIPLDDIQGFTPSSLPLPEDSLYQVEIEEELHLLLKTLSKREHNIVYMKFFEGFTNKVIAKKLNLSETNVGTILYRVIKKLREEMLKSNEGKKTSN